MCFKAVVFHLRFKGMDAREIDDDLVATLHGYALAYAIATPGFVRSG
jgi:hypothetical protein